MKLAIIQMAVSENKRENLRRAEEHIAKAAEQGADIAVLPEMFCCPYDTKLFAVNAELEGGESFLTMANCARSNNIWIVAGSMPECDENGKIYNTLYMYRRDGSVAAKHRKVHLFDVDIKGGQNFKESEVLSAGNSITVAETEFGKIGLAICYDIRFPEMFARIATHGAKLVIVPASFNMTTGPAHWELIFRARALDNQMFFAGVATARNAAANYVSYAHSIVTNPWGEVLLQMSEQEGVIVCEVDIDKANSIREQLPLLKHRRLDIYN